RGRGGGCGAIAPEREQRDQRDEAEADVHEARWTLAPPGDSRAHGGSTIDRTLRSAAVDRGIEAVRSPRSTGPWRRPDPRPASRSRPIRGNPGPSPPRAARAMTTIKSVSKESRVFEPPAA